MEFEGIILNKTGGSHGTTEMYAVPQLAEILDEGDGRNIPSERPSNGLFVGDTVWTAEVNKAINRYKPDVMIMNTGDARTLAFPNDGIIMGLQDVAHARQNVTKYKTYHGAHGCSKPYVRLP